ncbi:hypothetical protein ABKN59_003006 [Abortiporus biennis]
MHVRTGIIAKICLFCANNLKYLSRSTAALVLQCIQLFRLSYLSRANHNFQCSPDDFWIQMLIAVVSQYQNASIKEN